MNIKNIKMLKVILSLALLISASIIISNTYNDPQVTILVNYNSFDDVSISTLESYGLINTQFSIIPTVEVTVPASTVGIIASLPGVKSVQENQIYQVSVVPNDPDYGQLWGMDKINAPAAWDIRTDASSVTVAVIDTGVQLSHPDLANNKWTNPGEIAGNGIDDDGNGYVDDINGWDFANNDASYYDSTADDHGTHVSGTIGGVGNNGIGVAGVSWNVKIMALKFLTATGGSTTNAISAIQYATQMGADIISASWGGGGYDQALKDAIEAFPGLFIAAAGNDASNNDATPSYPATYNSANIVSVASTTETDGMSSFSNWGATTVDLGAPGSNIYSTWPSNTYNTISGTSMATPHVSGAAALILANDPSLTPAQLKAKLMDFADPIAALSGKTVSGGRLNLYASLTGTAPPPPPPSVTETFTGSVSPDQTHYFTLDATGTISASLSWGTTSDVDMYLYGPGQDTTSTTTYLARAYTTANPESLSYSATSTGTYAIRVNLYSGATSSYTLDVTHPAGTADTTAPSQVTGLSASTVSNSQIDLSWSAATDDTGVTGYNIYRGGSLLTSTTATSYSDTGLTGSTTYTYTVSAYDAAGNEGAQSSSASATTSADPDTTAPSQVTGLTATAVSTSQIDLSWSAATDNVGVTGYNIYRGGSLLTTTTSTSYSDTGLNSGTTYSYTVSAYDAAGNEGAQSSSASATTNSIPDTTAPSQVTGLTATTVSSSQIDLSWSAATDNVGVTGYNIYRGGVFLTSTTSTSFSDTGLTESTTYSYTVTAYDAAGNEGAQSSSASATTDAVSTGPITETFTGTVSSASPNQIFYFDVGSAGDISAVLNWAGSTDLDMYLYAPGADPTASTGYLVRAYTLSNPESMTYAATAIGQYAIRVNFYSGSTVSFTLDVTHPPGSSTPPPAAVTETFTGTVSSASPDQIFYFDVGSAGDISAVLNWIGSTDIDMYLYAPGADPTASTGYLVRAYTTSNPESMTYSATITGQYAIRVNFYSGSTVDFTLEVTHPPAAVSVASIDIDNSMSIQNNVNMAPVISRFIL